MARAEIVFCLFLALALAAYGGAYFVYGQTKLSRLKPRSLTGSVEWAGPTEAPRKLLLIGDSRVAQWPLRPPPSWRVGKLGFSGEAAVNIAQAARAVLAETRPYAIAIQAGGNDATAAVFQSGATRAHTLALAVEALMEIGERARAAGAERVIVMTVPTPIAPEPWRLALMGVTQTQLIGELAPEIQRRASAHGFEVLDAPGLFQGEDGLPRLDYRRNGALHWSNAAYERLDAALFALLASTRR